AVRSFCELLTVDQHKNGTQLCSFRRGNHKLLHPELTATNLAHLKGDVTTWLQDAAQLAEYSFHRFSPFRRFSKRPDADLRLIDSVEPAAQPIVGRVINNIKE